MIEQSTTPRAAIRSGAAVLAIAWALSAGAAFAADEAHPGDENRDLVTVTATRIPQPVANVPATVTVIDAETIADQMASDIKDLVRFEPGVSVRRAPSRFGAAQGVTGRDGNAGFNIRGLEGNRVLIQVDGVRVPDGFEFGAQSAGRGDYVDLGVIKSVEILRGPASALYGSDGLAGAVSFVTSDPQDFLSGGKSIGGIARAAYDSADNQFSETGIVAGASGAWSGMVAYTRRDGHELDNKGTNESPNASRTAPNPQDAFSNALLAKIVWSPDDHNRVRLTYDHLDAHVRTDVLSGISAAVPVPGNGVIGLKASDRTRRDRVSLDWRYTGTGAIASAQVTGWYQDGENRQFTAEDRNTSPDRTRLNTFANRVFGASAELRSDFATGPLTHRLVYGGDVSFTRQQGERDGTVPTPPDVFPTRAFPITDYTLAGGYVSDEIGIADGVLTLFPALRFDHYSLNPKHDPLLSGFAVAKQSDSRVSPKFGAVVRPVEGVRLFANYARGFKAPSPTQVNQFFQNLSQGYTSIPNPNLRPETSETWEGGLKVGSGPIRAEVTGFTGRYKDFISQEVVGGAFTPANPAVFQFINLNRVKIEGVEGKIEARSGGFSGRLAVSYAKGTVTGTGGVKSPLSTIDPVKLVGGVGYDAPDRRFGGQLIATHSAQKPLSATTYVGTTGPASICTGIGGCFRPGGFTILDATAYVKVGDIVTVRAGIFNIFDRKYAWWSDVRGLAASSAVTDAYTQPGRNASVSLTARF
ncbi:TonB-dependent hemoglobin/transferrin/lactoferrin family receptor [Sphingomonas sp. QA11]|uniref:TonB-dependent hemoglobin/transferrin/lactoferrin family receptor n=1 Tax=Sphingomonas sp. QA11 TaxID=2950605 RepID=UPI00234933B6|nr:TonB-dependent hemoglobin/transferrin/lactoferrin family receptor [Sphingomonas sp. QA11]WCM27061.1 TonB-dependent hemoglobin/transferrin/lactoferrin family receptor [Sphingomonas sp. QA11]